MKKEEFLNILRKRLNVLEDSEIEDIISEYKGYIEEKVNRGLTEEEAVKELGNINEIINDLLAAYKVKGPIKEETGLNKFINKIMFYIDVFVETLNSKSSKDILRLIIELCIILILISLFKMPFSLLKELGWNIFSGMPLTLAKTFYGLWSFIIELSYFILAVILFIKIFEKRYFEGLSAKIITPREKTKVTKKEETNIEEMKEKNNFFNSITNICLAFLKFIVIICLLGVIFYLVGMSFAFGLMVYLIIKGVKYFGIAILFLALIEGGALLLELGINFISNKKQKPKKIFIEIISIALLSGIGLTFGAVEIANTEIIYDNYYKETKTLTKELIMDKDLSVHGYDNIIIDNSLENNIKIEYKYPDLQDNIDIDLIINSCGNNCYQLDSNIKYIKWNKVLLDNLIKNLKDKKIYTYEFYVEKIIYLSENNYKILQENNKKYNYHDNTSNFTNTYNILNITNKDNSDYTYLTLKDYRNEIETVRILKTKAKNINIGNNYDFTFEYTGNDLDLEDIEEIFDECILVDIKLTNNE